MPSPTFELAVLSAHDVVQRRGVERDARAGGADGDVGLDPVVAALGDGDAAAVAAQLVALDDGVGGELEDDGVADRALDDVVDDPVAGRVDDGDAEAAVGRQRVALDEVAVRRQLLVADGDAAAEVAVERVADDVVVARRASRMHGRCRRRG